MDATFAFYIASASYGFFMRVNEFLKAGLFFSVVEYCEDCDFERSPREFDFESILDLIDFIRFFGLSKLNVDIRRLPFIFKVFLISFNYELKSFTMIDCFQITFL